MQKAFIIFSGYNQRAIIAFCRVLKKYDAQFYIIASSENDPIFKTVYSVKVKAVRKCKGLVISEIICELKKIRNQNELESLIILPSSEFLNTFMLKNRKELDSAGCEIPIVSEDLYRLITNKFSFSLLCTEQGIPVPQKFTEPGKIKFPFVAKPRNNINASGKSLYPYLIYTSRDYSRFKSNEDTADFYFEEFIKGESYYLLYYFSSAGDVVSYSQRNILQQAEGKSIILAEPAEIHLSKFSAKVVEMLLKHDFTGLIMVEVRKNSDEFCVIEANPRLWGPSQLFVDNCIGIFKKFILDSIDQDEKPQIENREKNRNYLWFNGAVEMMTKKKKIVSFTSQHVWIMIIRNIINDIYLRSDTLKLFCSELWKNITVRN